jgi:hypothetical protein
MRPYIANYSRDGITVQETLTIKGIKISLIFFLNVIIIARVRGLELNPHN